MKMFKVYEYNPQIGHILFSCSLIILALILSIMLVVLWNHGMDRSLNDPGLWILIPTVALSFY